MGKLCDAINLLYRALNTLTATCRAAPELPVQLFYGALGGNVGQCGRNQALAVTFALRCRSENAFGQRRLEHFGLLFWPKAVPSVS
jgi:hypothetical protein